MIMFVNQFKGLIISGALASMGLSACVVSDNPYTNAAATTAAIGVANMLFYSLSDGYYYDQSYNRMPRNYHPEAHIPVQRVSSMDDYRRQHPQPQYQRGSQRGQYQQPAYSNNNNRRYDNSGRGRYQNNQYDDYQYKRGQRGNYR